MSYEKTTWETGDIVTAEKLNNLENGVASANGGSGVFVVNVTETYDEEMETTILTHDADINDIMNAWYDGKLIKTVDVVVDLDDPTITYTYTQVYGFCELKDLGDEHSYVCAISYRPQYVPQAGGWVTGFCGVKFTADGTLTDIEFV